jgi:7-cyano-7-deazaguanine synthase
MRAICVLTGGGIKGAVTAARNRDEAEIVLIHVDYGQASARAERAAVDLLAGWFPKARPVRIDVPAIARLSGGSSGAANRNSADAALSPAAMRAQFPVILSTAAQYALRIGATTLALGLSANADGAHLGLSGADAQTDGSRELIHTFNLMMDLLTPDGVELIAPLIDLRYGEIIRLGMRFGVPLDHTWTCAGAGPRACGRCDSCRARERAFADAKSADPLLKDTPRPLA